MLLSEKTSDALDILVGMYFRLNRKFDRACSIMANTWAMPNAADIIHHKLAHIFPLMADVVSGFKDECNLVTVYPETPIGDAYYDNMQSMFKDLLDECLGTYKTIKLTYKVAQDEGDFNAQAMLIDLMNKHTKIMAQVQTLLDKAEQMPTAYDTVDAHIEHWGINGIEL